MHARDRQGIREVLCSELDVGQAVQLASEMECRECMMSLARHAIEVARTTPQLVSSLGLCGCNFATSRT